MQSYREGGGRDRKNVVPPKNSRIAFIQNKHRLDFPWQYRDFNETEHFKEKRLNYRHNNTSLDTPRQERYHFDGEIFLRQGFSQFCVLPLTASHKIQGLGFYLLVYKQAYNINRPIWITML
jgi:hypothetical protein